MASKRYRLVFTEAAERDLDDIVKYISVELANPKAATDFLDHLAEISDDICLYPESGPKVDNEFVQKNVRYKIIGNYILYYLPQKEDKISYVLRIIYGRRDLRKITLL